MPSIMTLQGPQFNALGQPLAAPTITDGMKIALGLLAAGAIVGAAVVLYGRAPKSKPVRGHSMLDTIAREASSPEAYARRADAWNSSEREPVSQAKLVNAYLRTDPRGKSKLAAKLRRLLREAAEARLESRERMWSKMSRGLRGTSRPLYYLNYRDALKRAKRLAAETGTKIRVATGVDARNPERIEYVVAKTGDVPTGFTITTVVDPAGRVEASGARYHRMMKRRDGLAGYRVWYGTSGSTPGPDGKYTFAVDDGRTLATVEQAAKLMRSYKRQGLWTWVEDEQGNFVPVPGAKSEKIRKSYPKR